MSFIQSSFGWFGGILGRILNGYQMSKEDEISNHGCQGRPDCEKGPMNSGEDSWDGRQMYHSHKRLKPGV